MTDADDILQKLNEPARALLDEFEVFEEIESTNTYLLQRAAPQPGRFRVALADHQTAGRGRDDKAWISPPGSGLCLSVAYTFAKTPDMLSSLTLATGAAIAKELKEMGVADVALKWPNDIVARNGKLGGILTELQTRSGCGNTVVIGIGLNVELPNAMRYAQASGWTDRAADLAECLSAVPGRTELAAAVTGCLISAITRFERIGFAAFRDTWQSFDWLRGKRVEADLPQGRISGIAEGVDAGGALLLRTQDGVARIISGSISIPGRATACA